MSKPLALEQLHIASPCPVKWESMRGNDTLRFCKHCSLEVHNISAMTREDAEVLLSQSTGRLCVSAAHTADGVVLTSARAPRAASLWVRRFAAMIGIGLSAAAPMACARPFRTGGSVYIPEPVSNNVQQPPPPSADVSQPAEEGAE